MFLQIRRFSLVSLLFLATGAWAQSTASASANQAASAAGTSGAAATSTPKSAAATAGPAAPANELNQRIEENIRAHFKVPPDVKINVGAISPSEFPGYNSVTVTLANAGHESPHEFYISKDGKTLAQLSKLDISGDPFNPAGRPTRGAANAKVSLIVYDDFECPYCARNYKTLFGSLMPDYKDKISVTFKDFPLYDIHPWAVHAAVDADCLYAQSNDAYWDFSDFVHGNQEAVSGQNRQLAEQFKVLDNTAIGYGQKHTLDMNKLQACVNAQDSSQVMASEKYGSDTLQIDATPTMFLNGTRMEGAVPEDAFRAALDKALTDAGVAPPQNSSKQNSGAAAADPHK